MPDTKKSDESALAKLDSEIVFEPTVLDGGAINDRMMRGIAEADTVDDILNANQTAVGKLDSIEGETVKVNAVSFHESADEYSEGGWGFFAVMELADGRVISTGAKTVVLKLYKLNKVNGFPLDTPVVFTAARTRSGWKAWDMTRAES